MNRYKDEKKLKDCEEIAKEFCRQIGAEYIYSNLYSIGYELNGVLIKKTWEELEKILKNKDNKII